MMDYETIKARLYQFMKTRFLNRSSTGTIPNFTPSELLTSEHGFLEADKLHLIQAFEEMQLDKVIGFGFVEMPTSAKEYDPWFNGHRRLTIRAEVLKVKPEEGKVALGINSGTANTANAPTRLLHSEAQPEAAPPDDAQLVGAEAALPLWMSDLTHDKLMDQCFNLKKLWPLPKTGGVNDSREKIRELLAGLAILHCLAPVGLPQLPTLVELLHGYDERKHHDDFCTSVDLITRAIENSRSRNAEDLAAKNSGKPTVELHPCPQIVLDGKAIALKYETAVWVQALIEARDWMSTSAFNNKHSELGGKIRTDRLEVPPAVAAHIESVTGKGSRWLT